MGVLRSLFLSFMIVLSIGLQAAHVAPAGMASEGGLVAAPRAGLAPEQTPGGPLTAETLEREGLVVGFGQPGEFDADELGAPTALLDGATYKMWYFGRSSGIARIGYATSPDGWSWTKHGVVLSPSLPEESGGVVAYPEVLKIGSEFWMWYSASDGLRFRIMLATSADGIDWRKQGVALDVGAPGSPDDLFAFDPTVVTEGGRYHMWYAGLSSGGAGPRLLYATSDDGLGWIRHGEALPPGPPGSLEEIVSAPAVRLIGLRYHMIYGGRASDAARLFFALSDDGVNWRKEGLALDILPPLEGTVGFPAFVVAPNGTWLVYYSARPSVFSVTPGLQTFLATRTPSVPGLLRVTTSIDAYPGREINGTIVVDGIPRDEGSLEGLPLSAGPHAVSFSDWPGLGTPADIRIDIVPAQVTEVRGVYQALGRLVARTEPLVPASISVDGIPRDTGMVSLAVPPGTYEIVFGPAQGYIAPRPHRFHTVTVAVDQVVEVVAKYRRAPGVPGPDPSSFGILQVSAERNDGSIGVPTQIVVDAVPRNEFLLTELRLAPGIYTVSFTDVPGLETAGSQQVEIIAGSVTGMRGTFDIDGRLHVTTEPVPGAILIDGVLRDRRAVSMFLRPGAYEVNFEAVEGFATPPAQVVTVEPGGLAEVVGRYVHLLLVEEWTKSASIPVISPAPRERRTASK